MGESPGHQIITRKVQIVGEEKYSKQTGHRNLEQQKNTNRLTFQKVLAANGGGEGNTVVRKIAQNYDGKGM